MAEAFRTFYVTIAASQGGPGYMTVTVPFTGASKEDEVKDYETAREKVFQARKAKWAFMYLTLEELHPGDKKFLGEIE